jgi:hypothetical protein
LAIFFSETQAVMPADVSETQTESEPHFSQRVPADIRPVDQVGTVSSYAQRCEPPPVVTVDAATEAVAKL